MIINVLQRENLFLRPLLAILCAFAVAAGCSITREAVDRRMILPVGADQYQVDESQHFLMAMLINSPMPEFPLEAKARDGRHEICVEFVVTENGIVEQISFPVDAVQCVPPIRNEAFQNAVVEALSQWSFTGAAICTFPEGVVKDDECESEGVEIRAVPIKLMYVFSFEQIKGRRSVIMK